MSTEDTCLLLPEPPSPLPLPEELSRPACVGGVAERGCPHSGQGLQKDHTMGRGIKMEPNVEMGRLRHPGDWSNILRQGVLDTDLEKGRQKLIERENDGTGEGTQ